jgi:hypothetical protein
LWSFQVNDLEIARIQFGKISAALIKLLSDYRPARSCSNSGVEADDVSDVDKITGSMASNGSRDSQSVHRNRDVHLWANNRLERDNELKSCPMIDSNDIKQETFVERVIGASARNKFRRNLHRFRCGGGSLWATAHIAGC